MKRSEIHISMICGTKKIEFGSKLGQIRPRLANSCPLSQSVLLVIWTYRVGRVDCILFVLDFIGVGGFDAFFRADSENRI